MTVLIDEFMSIYKVADDVSDICKALKLKIEDPITININVRSWSDFGVSIAPKYQVRIDYSNKKGKIKWATIDTSKKPHVTDWDVDIKTGQVFYNLYMAMTDGVTRNIKTASALSGLVSKSYDIALKSILSKKF